MQGNQTITLEQILTARQHGLTVLVRINGEYYDFRPDVEFDAYPVLRTVNIDGPWFCDIQDEGDYYGAWLYHKNYGVKKYLCGERKEYHGNRAEEFEKSVLSYEEYLQECIKGYVEAYAVGK